MSLSVLPELNVGNKAIEIINRNNENCKYPVARFELQKITFAGQALYQTLP